jgi:hypothetical protein
MSDDNRLIGREMYYVDKAGVYVCSSCNVPCSNESPKCKVTHGPETNNAIQADRVKYGWESRKLKTA